MSNSHLFKATRAILDRVLGTPISSEVQMPDSLGRLNGSRHEFMNNVHLIFLGRGYERVESEGILNEEFLLFTRNEALHPVYCLPCETYLTTIEIQACWEEQCRLGAYSSSVAAPRRFSPAAIYKAQSLAIEWLVI